MKTKTIDLVMIGVFAALIGVLSQISIPMPTGVPVTFQTFAVALCGYFLGVKKGTAAVFVYIMLGAVGAPVFTGFKGGFACIGGLTGGFIYGFLAMVLLCGLPLKNKPLRIVLGMAGIIALHFFGVLQYSLLTENGFIQSFLLVSAPYLIKDFISVVLGYFGALAMRRIKVAA